MRRGERSGYTSGDVEHLAGVESALGHHLAQRFAFDVFGGDVMHRIGVPDFVNRDDVRMIESGCGARLALEAADAFFIAREAGRQELQRHLAIEGFVLGEINLAHAACTDEATYAVARDRAGLHGSLRA